MGCDREGCRGASDAHLFTGRVSFPSVRVALNGSAFSVRLPPVCPRAGTSRPCPGVCGPPRGGALGLRSGKGKHWTAVASSSQRARRPGGIKGPGEFQKVRWWVGMKESEVGVEAGRGLGP